MTVGHRSNGIDENSECCCVHAIAVHTNISHEFECLMVNASGHRRSLISGSNSGRGVVQKSISNQKS